MTASFSRVCVLLPRLTDAEARFFDPYGQGVPWATRLFGSVGLSPFIAISEGACIVSARTSEDLIDAILRLDGPASLPSLGSALLECRVSDQELAQLPDQIDVLDVVELAVEKSSIEEIERLISCVPFRTYRVEFGRTEPLESAALTDFDWSPEFANFEAELRKAA